MLPRIRFEIILLGIIAPLGMSAPTQANEPTASLARSWVNPLRYRDLAVDGIDRLYHYESVEMFSAVLSGSEMGPGDGWFHPGQSRYDWKWLTSRFKAAKDGKITRKEFGGDLALFDRLDRNHDAELTPDDFDWSDQSPFLRQAGLASQWVSKLDSNSNGRVSREEWEAFFAKAAKGKDHITSDDLREILYPPSPPNAQKGGGPSPLTLIAGLFNGELGSWHEGPGIGDEAPDFLLKTHDGKSVYSLSQYRGKKPVVLIFGSFT